MADEARLDRIEARLGVLEQLVRGLAPQPSAPADIPAAPPEPDVVVISDPTPVKPPPKIRSHEKLQEALAKAPATPAARPVPLSGGVALAWGGGIALVLAAAYLVGIGITSGWLTPVRQVLGAAIAGLIMVGGGIALRQADRPFSSLLGAAGIVILYVAVLAAYMLHQLVTPLTSVVLVTGIALSALVLHVLYRSHVYAAFALLGSYGAPLLVYPGVASLSDIGIYLFLWNLTYCVVALHQGNRYPYVAALYGSMLVFDGMWRVQFPSAPWSMVAGFHGVLFLVFATQLVLFSRKRPLATLEAWGHLPAILLFYGVEYQILSDHYPRLVPWLALGFAAAVYAVYFAARKLSTKPLSSGPVVHTLGAFVVFHAVFIDLLSQATRPLGGILLLGGSIVLVWWSRDKWLELVAYPVAGALSAALGYVLLCFSWDTGTTLLEVPLAVLYPAAAYFVYAFSRDRARVLALGVGHLVSLISIALLVDRFTPAGDSAGRFYLSIAWAVFGVALVAVARARQDVVLAKSSLGIFALFAGKVLLLDLSGSAPLVRVGSLAVLGVSLYGGSWMYRRIFPARTEGSPAEPS